MKRPTIRALVITTCFFASGFSTLLYEIVWQRIFLRLVGTTTLSTTLTLSMFMIGLAMGALLFGSLIKKERNYLKLFALLEGLTGLFGFLSIWFCDSVHCDALFNLVSTLLAGSGQQCQLELEPELALVYAIVFAFLLVPTMCMGATLPVLAGYAQTTVSSPYKMLLQLYAFNTAGAVVGTICGGIIIMPALGVTKSIIVAAAINILVALTSGLLSNKDQKQEQNKVKAEEIDLLPEHKNEPRTSSFICLAAVFISGLTFIALEVIWTRFLLIYLGSSTYALAIVISVCLTGIALSAFLVAFLSGKIKDKQNGLVLILSICALSISICLHQYSYTPYVYLGSYLAFFQTLPSIEQYAATTRIFAMATTSLWLILIPSIAAGSIFPYCLTEQSENLYEDETSLSKRTAYLYFANVTGCVFGSALVHYLFAGSYPSPLDSRIQIGTMALSILILCFAVSNYLMRPKSQNKKGLLNAGILAAITTTLVVLAFVPTWNKTLMSFGYPFISTEDLNNLGVDKYINSIEKGKNGRTIFYKEATNSTITIKENRDKNLVILNSNGKAEAAIPINKKLPCPLSDLPTHTLMGLSASILCPSNEQDCLVIGYGTGTTCGTALSLKRVKRLVAVEVEGTMFSLDSYFRPSNLDPLKEVWQNQGRVKTVVADARNYLALSNRSFDTIVSQPAEPWVSGSQALYTSEFFDLAKSKLKKDGVFCQWIQLYSISKDELTVLLNTFHKTFKDTAILHSKNAGEIILTGFAQKPQIDLTAVKKRLQEDKSAIKLLRKIGIYNESDYLALFKLYPDEISTFLKSNPQSKINTDDNLFAEFNLARYRAASEQSIDELTGFLFKTVRQGQTANSTAFIKGDPIDLARLCLAQTRTSLAINDLDFERDLLTASEDKNNYRTVFPAVMEHANQLLERIKTKADPHLYSLIRVRMDQLRGQEIACDERTIVEEMLPDNDGFTNTLLAEYWLKKGNRDMALAFAKAKAKGTNQDASTLLKSGQILIRLQNLDNAIENLLRANNLDQDSPEILTSLALAQRLKGRDDNSTEELLRHSLSLDPNQYLARYLLGQLTFKNGDIQGGLTEMYYANRVSRGFPSALVFIVAAFVEGKDYKLAQRNLNILARQYPDYPYIEALQYRITEGLAKQQKGTESAKTLKEKYDLPNRRDSIETICRNILANPIPENKWKL